MGIQVYKVEDLMELLGVTRRTIYNHIKDEKIKGNKIAGKWIFSEEQVKDYMEGRVIN